MSDTETTPTHAREQIIKDLEIIELPEACKSLNAKQLQWADEYFQSLNASSACKIVGYSKTYGHALKKDARIQVYLNYLGKQLENLTILSKAQVIEILGERILDKTTKNKDLSSLVREIRYIKGWNDNINMNLQVNIKLPDTYNQFFESSNEQESDQDSDFLEIE